MWRKREIMEVQKSVMDKLLECVPTDVSGKWVNREELRAFGESVASYIIEKLEKEAKESDSPELYGICMELQDDFNL
jgi:hypothetical protein